MTNIICINGFLCVASNFTQTCAPDLPIAGTARFMAYTDFYWAALSLVVYPQGLRNDVEIFLIIVYSYKHTVRVVS